MKQQKLDLDNKNKSLRSIKGMPLFFCGIVLFIFSCKSDMDKVQAFASEIELPDIGVKNLDTEYTDTGKIQLRFISPTVNQYKKAEEPYFEFPDGIEVIFYDTDEQVQSIITANYSIYYEKKQLWEARDSVVARNMQEGQRIESEQMFWDQGKQLIYSEAFTKITDEDGIYYGEKGFEAAQDLTYYRLIGSSGTVRVQDEE